MTQRVNSLTFTTLAVIPSVGDALIDATSGAQGTVIKVTGTCVMANVTADFSIGDIVTDLTPNAVIGTVASVYGQDVLTINDTIQAQFANSPSMVATIQSMLDAIDPYMLFDAFYNDVWNIDTATDYGLAIWGRIVGVSRIIQIPAPAAVTGLSAFAWFAEEGVDAQPFGFAPLYGGVAASSSYTLTLDAFRALIKLKAAANLTDVSIPSLNKLLFGVLGVPAFVQSYGAMTIAIVFPVPPTPVQVSILKYSGVFPTPCGVELGITPAADCCQFSEAGVGASFPTFGYGSFFGGFA